METLSVRNESYTTDIFEVNLTVAWMMLIYILQVLTSYTSHKGSGQDGC